MVAAAPESSKLAVELGTGGEVPCAPGIPDGEEPTSEAEGAAPGAGIPEESSRLAAELGTRGEVPCAHGIPDGEEPTSEAEVAAAF